ncbi:glycosyltransferase [Phocaeicola sartorii]|uniref:Glycosyltransferase n=1 Tax=Phocaeicola sartorii TaxID=671267 RepID=A0A4S2FFQ4_9BACT|nr:glycosyltransferase [Phocaeicola sartorii]TGY67494.1 glycosyltransferase [Phocaeicola sartorii]
MIQKDSPLVTIQCLTYNHEPYIRQCLEGFVMQQTDFCFEVIVHDDASTDGTANIIREYEQKYPDIIKPIYEKENQYSKHDDSLIRIINEHTRGKYIAFCEGDDYWIDSLKLQKQVDFLEEHHDYGAVYTDFEGYEQETGNRKSMNIVPKDGWRYNEMLCRKLNIWTLTTMVRREFIMNYYDIQEQDIFRGDIMLFLYITSKAKVKCIHEKTAVYRILKNSASHFTDKLQSIRFNYLGANTMLYYLKNGPKVPKSVELYALHLHGNNRIRYAYAFNKQKIILQTEYPFRSINSMRFFLFYILYAIGQFKIFFSILSWLFRYKYRNSKSV